MNGRDDQELQSALYRAADILRAARRLVVLTGAGISAESGVPTFRDADGLWEGHRVEDVATPEAFARDPITVWRFYNQRRENLRTIKPNPGHVALRQLEERFAPEAFTLVTQNVDGLHRLAGSENTVEIHGNIARTRCTGCGRIEDRGLAPLGDLPMCPRCAAPLRPDVVWINEPLSENIWPRAMEATHACDCMMVVGTSAVVYPAAGLILVAKQKTGRHVIEVNRERTAASDMADVNLFGPAGELLPRLVDLL